MCQFYLDQKPSSSIFAKQLVCLNLQLDLTTSSISFDFLVIVIDSLDQCPINNTHIISFFMNFHWFTKPCYIQENSHLWNHVSEIACLYDSNSLDLGSWILHNHLVWCLPSSTESRSLLCKHKKCLCDFLSAESRSLLCKHKKCFCDFLSGSRSFFIDIKNACGLPSSILDLWSTPP